MRKWLALGVQVPFVAMMWMAACSSDDSSNPDAGDGSIVDVKADKKVVPDTGGPVDTGPTCAPGDVNQADVLWAPPNPHVAACTDQQLSDLYTNCFQQGGDCSGFLKGAANVTCAACLTSQQTAATWGAIVIDSSGGGLLNVGGCLALQIGDTSSTGCGASYQERLECTYLACSDNCAQASSADFNSCLDSASTGTCATENTAVTSNCADAGAANDACALSATDGLTYIKAVAGAFCGGYTGDGGTTDGGASDAGTDAAQDGGGADAAADATADAPDGD